MNPEDYDRLPDDATIQAGDIIVDCGGTVRGPIPTSWEGVGKPVSDYTVNRSGIGQPAARAILRPK